MVAWLLVRLCLWVADRDGGPVSKPVRKTGFSTNFKVSESRFFALQKPDFQILKKARFWMKIRISGLKTGHIGLKTGYLSSKTGLIEQISNY